MSPPVSFPALPFKDQEISNVGPLVPAFLNFCSWVQELHYQGSGRPASRSRGGVTYSEKNLAFLIPVFESLPLPFVL